MGPRVPCCGIVATTPIRVLFLVLAKGKTLFADRLAHASIWEGVRLSGARWARFRHNDVAHLAELLAKKWERGGKQVWIITESLFSMGFGDLAPPFLPSSWSLNNNTPTVTFTRRSTRCGYLWPRRAGRGKPNGASGGGRFAGGYPRQSTLLGGCLHAPAKGIAQADGKNQARPFIFLYCSTPLAGGWSFFIFRKMMQMQAQRSHLRAMVAELLPSHTSQIIPIRVPGKRGGS